MIALYAGAGMLLLAATAWLDRREIARHFVERRLAAAGVPGRYRITAFGPFAQRIEDVRIGDPAHPDLVARRIDLEWRYGFGGPALAAIHVDAARLAAQWRGGRLSLGTIDRLLPRSSGGGARLPDMRVTLVDTRLAVGTPAGMAILSIAGSGNPARVFHGVLHAAAPVFVFGGCTAADMRGRLALRIVDQVPHLAGPVGIGGLACPSHLLATGPGSAGIDLRIAPTLDRASGEIRPSGFAGRWNTMAFGPLTGMVRGTGDSAGVKGRMNLALTTLAFPQGHADQAALTGGYHVTARRSAFAGHLRLTGMRAGHAIRTVVREAAANTAGTPIGAIGARLGERIDGLLAHADLEARIALADGAERTLRIERATLASYRGDIVLLDGSLAGTAGGWRVDGHLAGDALPAMGVRALRPAPAAALEAVVRIAPYRTERSALALAPLRIVIAGGRARFVTTATIDGPLDNGSIEGLVLPLAGTIGFDGSLAIGAGCNAVRFRRARLATTMLDAGQATICGTPVVARSPSGVVRIAGQARGVAIDGRSGSAPLAIRAESFDLSGTHFDGTAVTMAIGAPEDDPTRLAIHTLDGRIGPRGLSGHFTDAAGVIGHVPLALSDAVGDWRWADGALHLDGRMQVADRAASPRFMSLAAPDVAFMLVDGRITAQATLQAQARRSTQAVARVSLRHDLMSGIGGVDIAVPGLAFARGGMQPEMLTPLTLGIVANVSGMVTGDGRIDWSPMGVASTGSFRTDRIDLAAAFGPVTGLSGTIRFTDLLGLVTAPHQEARIAAINPGVAVNDGVVRYRLPGGDRVAIEEARWPFAGGTLALDPAMLDFSGAAERRLTFHIAALDAAAFVQQLDFPNLAATGTFDGRLPMIFDQTGGRIEDGMLAARTAGTLAYVGEMSNADLGRMGHLAFDALKAIRYSGLDIRLDGKLDGEIVSRVRFDGVRQATGERGLVARMIRNLPFRFNIEIRAPFRGLVGSARSYLNPALLLQPGQPPAVQPPASAIVR